MALLIPTTADESIIKHHSYAEAKIVKLIKNLDPVKTTDWVIYYSYYFKGRTKGKSSKYTMIKNQLRYDF